MKDKDKTKEQLISELNKLRQKVVELEKTETEYKQKEAVLKEKVERFESVFEAGPLGISVHDENGKFLQCNQALLEMLGYSTDELAKYDFTHPDDQNEGKQLHNELISGKREIYRREKRYIHKDGHIVWARLTAAIVRDEFDNPLYTVFMVDDITNCKQAEEKLYKVNRALRMLSNCNQVLIRTTDESRLLHRICRNIVKIGGYRLAWVGYAKEDEDKSVQPVAQMGFSDGYLETADITWADTERGRGPTGTAIRTGKPSIARNIQEASDYAPWRDEATKRGYASSIALPLTDEKGKTFGVLNIYATEPDAFDTEEVELLRELANDLAYGIVALRTRTERKKAEETLRKSEQEKAAILNNMSEIVTYQDMDLRILWANKSASESADLAPEQMVGRYCYEMWHQRDKPCVGCPVEKAIKTGQPQEAEMLSAKGETVFIRGYPIRDADGNVESIVEVALDITEQKRAEDALRKSEEKYHRFFQTSKDCAFITSKDGFWIDMNEAAVELFGYKSRDELRQVRISEIYENPADRVKHIRVIEQQGFTKEYPVNLRRKDGSVINTLITTVAIKDDDRNVIGFQGTIRDISEQKKMEENLQKKHELLQSIFDEIPVMITLYDSNLKDFSVNKELERVLGWTNKDTQRVDLMEKCYPDESYRKEVREFMLSAGESDEWRDLKVTTKEGKVVESSWTNIILSDDRQVGIGIDITERRKIEEELKKHQEHLEELVKERTQELNEKNEELSQANIHLQEMNRLKSVFLASMSHELRTPLNSIIGFTGVLLMGMAGELNDQQRKQLTIVKNSANHLLSLINDVLDISKIEAGKIDLSPEKFELKDVVREVVESFSHKIDEKLIQLLTEISEEITLYSDRRRVKQILMNLVSNAVKFTDYGNVKIGARMLNDEILEIQVTDTGIGIEEEDMNKLFNPFMQIDMSLTKNYEGTGLGLYLCKKLVNLLGGDISAESEYGKGSVFTFVIPLHY